MQLAFNKLRIYNLTDCQTTVVWSSRKKKHFYFENKTDKFAMKIVTVSPSGTPAISRFKFMCISIIWPRGLTTYLSCFLVPHYTRIDSQHRLYPTSKAPPILMPWPMWEGQKIKYSDLDTTPVCMCPTDRTSLIHLSIFAPVILSDSWAVCEVRTYHWIAFSVSSLLLEGHELDR